MTAYERVREELIENMSNLVKKHSNSGISHKLSYTMKRWELELVADFILEDRKRVVEPLVEVLRPHQLHTKVGYRRAMKQTLKNAGVTL